MRDPQPTLAPPQIAPPPTHGPHAARGALSLPDAESGIRDCAPDQVLLLGERHHEVSRSNGGQAAREPGAGA